MSREDHREEEAGALVAADWIEQIAESEGVDEDEVVQRLVSSYWTLQEMHGMIEDAGSGGGESPKRSLADAVADLDERLTDVEEAFPDREEVDAVSTDLRREIEALRERVTEIEAELAEEHETLESRLDAELVNIRTILTYLIETTDDLEEEIEAIEARGSAGR